MAAGSSSSDSNVKTLLFANTAWYLYNFRLPLAMVLRAEGHNVVLVSPGDEYSQQLKEAGFKWIDFPFSRKGQNPIQEIGTILRLAKLYREEKPDLVHHFTVKCVLYGSLAAKLTGIRRVVNSITGLGYLFIGNNLSLRIIRPIVLTMYRIGLKSSQVIFQNEDDLRQFQQYNLVEKKQVNIIRGSGVDIQRFTPTPEPDGRKVVVLPARMLWDKGVAEFVQAARILGKENLNAIFVLVGDTYTENPAAVPEAMLREWQSEGVVEWWGWQSDMPGVYAKSHIVCLPSYREGLPKTLIEAAACARPLVAFDAPGSREVVINGDTGLLARFKDAGDLADCLRKLLMDAEGRHRMGLNARILAEKEFSTDRIVRETLTVYSKLQGDGITE